MFVEHYEEEYFDKLANPSCISATLITPLKSSTNDPNMTVISRQQTLRILA